MSWVSGCSIMRALARGTKSHTEGSLLPRYQNRSGEPFCIFQACVNVSSQRIEEEFVREFWPPYDVFFVIMLYKWPLLLKGQKAGGGSLGKVGSFSPVLLPHAIGQVRYWRGRKGTRKCWKQSLAARSCMEQLRLQNLPWILELPQASTMFHVLVA